MIQMKFSENKDEIVHKEKMVMEIRRTYSSTCKKYRILYTKYRWMAHLNKYQTYSRLCDKKEVSVEKNRKNITQCD